MHRKSENQDRLFYPERKGVMRKSKYTILDIDEELKNYNPIVLSDDMGWQATLDIPVCAFEQEIRKLGKTQQRVIQQIDMWGEELQEQLKALEGFKNQWNEIYRDEQRRAAVAENIAEDIIRTLIAIMDQLESIYRYGIKFGNESWQEQLDKVWAKTGQLLAQNGITRIEYDGTTYNPEIQTAVDTVYQAERTEGEVIDVVQSGYYYNGRLLRKARVIINLAKEVHE